MMFSGLIKKRKQQWQNAVDEFDRVKALYESKGEMVTFETLSGFPFKWEKIDEMSVKKISEEKETIVTYCKFPAKAKLNLHKHDCLETILLLSGSIKIYNGENKFLQNSGDVYSIPPNHSHAVYTPEGCEIVVIFSK